MFFKSLRARLQIWYGVILVAVLAGFGVTAYELQRSKQFRSIDDELLRRVSELRNALRMSGLPPRTPGMEAPDGPLPEQRDFRRGPPPESERLPFERRPLNGPPPDDGMFPRAEFHLPPHQAALFDST